MTQEISAFIQKHEQTIEPLYKDYSLKIWELSTAASDEREKALIEAKERYLRVYNSKEEFQELRAWRNREAELPDIEARQLRLIYDLYVPNQIDPAILSDIVRRETEIETDFNTFRASFENGHASDNQLRDILKSERNVERRRAAWQATKEVGQVMAPKLLELVTIRNQEANKLGYSDYYSMMFELQELDEAWVFSLFDRLDDMSKPAFVQMKTDLDARLKNAYGLNEPESYPWLYADPFFQEFPSAGVNDSLDEVFQSQNVEQLTNAHYSSIGLNITELLASADLYERDGKSQHAFCLDVDHNGDVRVLCNIQKNERWMSTMLHEFGHAVYDRYNDPALPFTLRMPAHILTTEAIAMLNGRMSKDPLWLARIAGVPESEARRLSTSAFKTLRSEMLIFLRWALTLVRFEREMYRNPQQNLNRLWWEYVSRYQLVTPPSNRDLPDWASKIHLATSPAYYQNYVLGELMASQLLSFIQQDVVKKEEYAGNPAVGHYLVEKIFRPGARYPWNELVKRATGQDLSVEYFTRQFVSTPA
jgi:peptidyl-dipeptidase A